MNSIPFPAAHEPTEAEIQKKAYYLWLEGGCREGTELDNWFAAKELLLHHHGRTVERPHAKPPRTTLKPVPSGAKATRPAATS